jgi:hypothetical protein
VINWKQPVHHPAQAWSGSKRLQAEASLYANVAVSLEEIHVELQITLYC